MESFAFATQMLQQMMPGARREYFDYMEHLAGQLVQDPNANIFNFDNLYRQLWKTTDGFVDGIMNTIAPHGAERNPKYPRCPGGLCSMGLCNAMEGLMRGAKMLAGPGDPYEEVSNNYPDLPSALFSFALSIRTEEELHALEDRLCVCRCAFDACLNPSAAHLHDRAMITSLRSISTPIFLFLQPLATIDNKDLHRSQDRAQRRQGEDSFRELRHYILDAPQDTLIACQHWYNLTKDPNILAFLSYCFNHHHFSFVDLAPSDTAQSILSLAAAEMDTLVTHVCEGVASITDSVADDLKKHVGIMTIFLRHLPFAFEYSSKELIHATALAFFKFLDGVDPSVTDVWESLNKRRMPQEYALVAYMTLPVVPNSAEAFGEALVNMYSVMRHMPLDFEGARGPYISTWDTLMHLLSLLDSDCFNRVCDKKPKGKRFAKCSGCGIPSYCSTACQTTAWTDPECPHKAVCKTTKKLLKYWPSDERKLPKGRGERDEFLKTLVATLKVPESRIKEISDNYGVLMRAKRPIGPYGDVYLDGTLGANGGSGRGDASDEPLGETMLPQEDLD